ncbi:sigma-54-dependent Fis family transcriptional regulator [candidate division KSB1 bacterium]|nr:sigma-54-dependent Fis family transcriptional regulator [candidate division KSB1 bacterium]
MTPKKTKILIADDDTNILTGLKTVLIQYDYSVRTARDGREAINKLQKTEFPVLLTDLEMPHAGGLDILEFIRSAEMSTQVIFITGKGTIATAVDAMKKGAYDYLTKPVSAERLISIIPKAVEHYELLVNYQNLEQRIKSLTHFEDLVGQSKQMLYIYKMIETVAESTATVIITGESGTGKELVAKAIHRRSPRGERPFIAVNCSAFPEDILENELFGHEKGAFTGAIDEKPGCFELADTGTLFLDEIGEMSLQTQAKILRALEEKRYRRLGGKKEIQVDVRVLAATNRNLKKAIEQKTFREDLYFRLCVVEIDIPPLRDRIEDIHLLIDEFLHQFNQLNGKNISGLTSRCREILLRYGWPGNVRELRNTIERAVIMCKKDQIDIYDLPDRILTYDREQPLLTMELGKTLEEAEKKYVLQTLQMVDQNKSKAAQILGISVKGLYNKLEEYGE